jgi:hypothetical protein
MIYYLMYFKYIFEFFIFLNMLNKTSDQSWCQKVKHQTFGDRGGMELGYFQLTSQVNIKTEPKWVHIPLLSNNS